MMKSEFTYKQYIDDVVCGKIVTGELIKFAVARHIVDFGKQNTKGFPYYFDEKQGQRFIKFAQLCNHWKGDVAGKKITLEPWQQFYFILLFGWMRPDGSRRFRSSYLEIGRKNGKTTLCAVKALGHIVIDKEPGAQVYIAATKEDQARIGFKDVQEIINATPDLKKLFTNFVKSTVNGSSFIKPLGSDSNTQDGFDPSYGIIDEYHAHPTSGMLNVLESGMASRKSPLIDIITTAGFNRHLPCYSEVRKSSIEILKGIKHDETHLALIYTLDENDDWKNEKVWLKANPNIGVSVRLDFLRDRLQKAKNEGGSKEIDFKTKNLNIWTDSAKTWIPDEVWSLGNQEIDLPELEGLECYAALDLASNRDLTCLCLLFRIDERVIVLMYYFVPELSAKERVKKDGVNYDTWIRDGFIDETEGNVTDYGHIRNKVNELREIFNIKRVAYDRWNSSQLIIDLTGDGVECVPFGQGYGSMSAPCKELEKMAHGGQIVHGGNPVLRWNNSNVALMTDPAGNIKINKAKSSEKVDGMVALVMALGNYMSEEKTDDSFTGEIIMI